MRVQFLLLLSLISSTKDVAAFSSNGFATSKGQRSTVPQKRIAPWSRKPSVTSIKSSLNGDGEDCGCAPTIFSGKPSDIARASNPYQSIRQGSILGLDSEKVQMDELLDHAKDGNSVSIVVFLRSLG